MSQKKTESVSRHREDGSLPKVNLVVAPLQLREPITPWGATKAQSWLTSLGCVSKVQMSPCS